MQTRLRLYVHRQQLGHRHGFADRRAGSFVGGCVGRVQLGGMNLGCGQQVGAFGMDDQHLVGLRGQLQRAQLIGLAGKDKPVEFILAAHRGRGGEDLERHRPFRDHRIARGGGQVAHRRDKGQSSTTAFSAKWSRRRATSAGVEQQGFEIGISKIVVTPPAAAARVSDLHRAAFGIGGRANVEVDVDDAGHDRQPGRVDDLGRLGRRTRGVDAR